MKTDRKPVRAGTKPKAGKTKARAVPKPASIQIGNLLERVSDGIVAFDAQMNYTYVNQKGGDLLGRKPKDLIGKNYWTEYPEAKNTPFAKAYARALETQETIVLEDYYAPFDRWFENRIYPSKNGLTIFFTEITERKKGEQFVRESQERLALTIRSANIGLWDWDLQTNKVRYSPEWKSQVGYEDREISDDFSEWESRVHPEDLERAKATVSRYIEKPYPNFHNEFRMRHKDGSYRWILAQAALLCDERGKPIRMIGMHIDITERKQIENELIASRDHMTNILNSITDAFITLDRDWRITYINPEAARINKKSAEEFIGKTHWEEWPASVGTIVESNYRKAMDEGLSVHFEHRYFVEGQYDVWLDIHTYPTNDGLAIYYHDITERKRAEAELRLSRDRLADLSRRLSEIRESEARSIGRELHDQIGQMLTAMKITLDIAVQLPAEAAAKKIAQAQELTADLLNRVSALSLELRPPMLDDFGLIPALTWQVNRFQEQSGVAVAFKHGGVEGKRFAAEIETAAYRIVQESLTNVARHARATSVRIEVEERGGWLEIQIEDDGAGFDPESAFAKNRGLSGMRERALLLGGAFQVESGPGKGARKFIRLPLREEIP